MAILEESYFRSVPRTREGITGNSKARSAKKTARVVTRNTHSSSFQSMIPPSLGPKPE